MIDTSKAVRPCVEELAAQVNGTLIPYSPQPLFRWCDVHQNFVSGSTTINGATLTNNDDGTFSITGNASRASVLPLTNAPIVIHTKNIEVYKDYLSNTNKTAIYCAFPLLLTMLRSEYSIRMLLTATFTVSYTINGEQAQTSSAFSTWISSENIVFPLVRFVLDGDHRGSEIVIDTSNIETTFQLTISTGQISSRINLLMYDIAEILNTVDGAKLYKAISGSTQEVINNNILRIVRALPEFIPNANMATLENALYKERTGNMSVETNVVVGANRVFDRTFNYYTFNS